MAIGEELKNALKNEAAKSLRSLADWIEAGGVEKVVDTIRDRVHKATAPRDSS